MFSNSIPIPGTCHKKYTSSLYPQSQRVPMFCENSCKRRGRPVSNAARERSRVKTLRSAFLNLQETLPSVPPDTKLSKLDILILAATYITHLMKTLDSYKSGVGEVSSVPTYHPVKKWPMRTRLYDGILESTKPSTKRKKSGFSKQCYSSTMQDCCPVVTSASSDEYINVDEI